MENRRGAMRGLWAGRETRKGVEFEWKQIALKCAHCPVMLGETPEGGGGTKSQTNVCSNRVPVGRGGGIKPCGKEKRPRAPASPGTAYQKVHDRTGKTGTDFASYPRN